MSAQEEALLAHLRGRGFVAPGELEQANAERGAQPLVQLLTRRGLISPADLGRLLGELQGHTYACACRSWRYSELAPLPGLGCPTCHAPLVAAAPPQRQGPPTTGRLPAVPAGLPLAHERVLGPYELLRELGRGTMGVVFLARRGPDGPPVALKVILEEASDEEGRLRFQREASIAMRLDHPGIVRALDVGRAGGRGYDAMEFVEGKTLHQHLGGGPLEPREAASILARVARAVEAAHAKGVIHRDLKPANIMLADPDGTPRITDFGLARDEGLSRSLTRTGALLGTPLTMSPEQIRGEKVDPRADVYGLGAILYRCLTGHFPFEAATPVELARAVLDDVPVLPSSRRPGLPSALDEVTLRALARDRGDRYPGAGAFAEALEQWLGAEQGRPRRSGRQARGLPAPPGRRGGPPKGVLVGAAVVAVVAASAAGVAFGLRGRTTTGVTGVATPAPAPAPAPAPPPSPTPTPPATEAQLPPSGPSEERATGVDPILIEAERGLVEALRGGGTDQERDRWARLCFQVANERQGDPHATALGVMARLSVSGRGSTHARRWMAMVAPRLGHDARLLAALLSWELGFQRAASDLALSTLGRDDEVLSPWAGMLVCSLLLKTAPPVRDPARCVAVQARVVEALERDPTVHRATLVQTGAAARLLLGDRDGAVRALRAAARVAEGTDERGLTGAADELESGALTGESALRRLPLRLAIGEFLTRLGQYEEDPRITDTTVARSLRQDAYDSIAESKQREHERDRDRDGQQDRDGGWGRWGGSGRRVASSALTLVRASRAWLRVGEAKEARGDLERAWELVKEGEAYEENGDVTGLVALELARLHLEADHPERAIELAQLAARPWPEAHNDIRTAGERADPWVVIARAHLARGERDKARQALASAEAAAPYDRRELDALAVELER
jgi:predicted Ser/Thr protein kinase